MAKTKAKTNDFPVIEDTPVITEAVALATLNDEPIEEPVVSGEFADTDSINEIDDDSSDDDEADETAPVSEHPTVDEAKAMFEANPGLSDVLTDRGVVRRVDILGGKKLGLDGLYR